MQFWYTLRISCKRNTPRRAVLSALKSRTSKQQFSEGFSLQDMRNVIQFLRKWSHVCFVVGMIGLRDELICCKLRHQCRVLRSLQTIAVIKKAVLSWITSPDQH